MCYISGEMIKRGKCLNNSNIRSRNSAIFQLLIFSVFDFEVCKNCQRNLLQSDVYKNSSKNRKKKHSKSIVVSQCSCLLLSFILSANDCFYLLQYWICHYLHFIAYCFALILDLISSPLSFLMWNRFSSWLFFFFFFESNIKFYFICLTIFYC